MPETKEAVAKAVLLKNTKFLDHQEKVTEMNCPVVHKGGTRGRQAGRSPSTPALCTHGVISQPRAI